MLESDAPESLIQLAFQCVDDEPGNRPIACEILDWIQDLLNDLEDDIIVPPRLKFVDHFFNSNIIEFDSIDDLPAMSGIDDMKFENEIEIENENDHEIQNENFLHIQNRNDVKNGNKNNHSNGDDIGYINKILSAEKFDSKNGMNNNIINDNGVSNNGINNHDFNNNNNNNDYNEVIKNNDIDAIHSSIKSSDTVLVLNSSAGGIPRLKTKSLSYQSSPSSSSAYNSCTSTPQNPTSILSNINPRAFTPPRIVTPISIRHKSLYISHPDDLPISGTEFRRKSLRSPGYSNPGSVHGIGNQNGNGNGYMNNGEIDPISPLTPAESAFAKSKKIRDNRGGGGGGGGVGDGEEFNEIMTNNEVLEDIEKDKENNKLILMEEIEMEIKMKMALNRERNINISMTDEVKETFDSSDHGLIIKTQCISGRRRAYSTMTYVEKDVPITFTTPVREPINEEVTIDFLYFLYYYFYKCKKKII